MLPIALALLAACAGPEEVAAPAPVAPPQVVPEPPPPDPTLAEARARRRENNVRRLRSLLGNAADAPVPGLVDVDPHAGRVAFRERCQVCHGLHARGDGPGAEALQPPPADLADPHLAGVYPDAVLGAVVRHGVPDTAMVGFEDIIEDDEILAITAWVRTLPAGPR